MARNGDSFWHGLGRGIESTISALPVTSTRSLLGRSRTRRQTGSPDEVGESGNVRPGALLRAISAFGVSIARRWSRTHRPSPRALARGAIAGAGAAGIVLLYRMLMAPRTKGIGDVGPEEAEASTDEIADELLAGAGRGLIYAALLDPYLPGPPILRGAMIGAADYLTAPLGGLFSRLQEFSPIRRVPVISILLETGDAEDDPFLLFLLHGALLGLIYGDGSD